MRHAKMIHKVESHVVILSEAKNLSSIYVWAKNQERFFASLRMTAF